MLRSFVSSGLRQLMRGSAAIGLDATVTRDERLRMTGIRLRWGREGPAVTRGSVYRHAIEGKDVMFFVANENDAIQHWHAEGEFFEGDELAIIRRFYKGGTFVDVGANIGNHCLYAALFLGAERIIAFEPDPRSLTLLDINLRLNLVRDRAIIKPVGLSDHDGRATIARSVTLNLGATRLREAENGELALVRGDDALEGEKVAFLKIDVESLEMFALRGLRKTIERDRPIIFIEVDDENRDEFLQLVDELKYKVSHEKRAERNANFLLEPLAT